MRRTAKFILAIILTVIVGCGVAYSSFNLYNSAQIQGFIRQKKEEKLADIYISNDMNATVTETEESTSVTYENSDLDYTDDNYFSRDGVLYTPDYAKGYLDCVLEIPCISLRRGVYSGTMDEIQHDLDAWMTVAAHPDYKLGKTVYCIYGHNTPTQDLSFNRLKDVQIGDYFLLTKDYYIYLYDVTGFTSEWRPDATANYVNNFELPNDKCYIITCGRDEYRYKDIIVEGTLREKYTKREWEDVKNDITADRVETPVTVSLTKECLKLSAVIEEDEMVISLTYPDGTPYPDTELCVTDSNGFFVTDKNGNDIILRTEADGTCRMQTDVFSLGSTYAIGVRDLKDDTYGAPGDIEITAGTDGQAENVGKENHMPDTYFYMWIGCVGVSLILFILCVVEIFKIAFTKRKERRNAVQKER